MVPTMSRPSRARRGARSDDRRSVGVDDVEVARSGG
jgi:hypothetical protein